MKICAQCQAEFDDEQRFCPHDGTSLDSSPTETELEPDPMFGRSVANRFTITGLIGEGGMGTVYSAVQEAVGRDVALKVIRRELIADERFVERFKREAQAVSRLKSPNTVTLYDFGQDDDGMLFLVMERLEGETLKERMASTGRLPWKTAINIARQIGESLAEAHDQGIIHRDLKPDNIFLTKEATGRELVKVVDFSISRFKQPPDDHETLTQAGTSLGTPGYMSPEQAQGQRVDGRSDLYSLGVMLYELISGRPPFEADSTVILLSKHITEKVNPIARTAPEVALPRGVDAFILRLLEKSPRQRPRSAVDVIAALDRLLDSKADVQETAPAGPKARTRLGDSRDDEDDSIIPNRITVAPTPPKGKRELSPTLLIVAGAVLAIGGILGLITLFVGSDEGAPALEDRADTTEANEERDVPITSTQTVDIEIIASPTSASIWLDDVELSSNPYRLNRLQSSEPHQLVVKAAGYVTQERTVQFSRTSQYVITLSKILSQEPTTPDSDTGVARRDGGTKVKHKRLHAPIVTVPP